MRGSTTATTTTTRAKEDAPSDARDRCLHPLKGQFLWWEPRQPQWQHWAELWSHGVDGEEDTLLQLLAEREVVGTAVESVDNDEEEEEDIVFDC